MKDPCPLIWSSHPVLPALDTGRRLPAACHSSVRMVFTWAFSHQPAVSQRGPLASPLQTRGEDLSSEWRLTNLNPDVEAISSRFSAAVSRRDVCPRAPALSQPWPRPERRAPLGCAELLPLPSRHTGVAGPRPGPSAFRVGSCYRKCAPRVSSPRGRTFCQGQNTFMFPGFLCSARVRGLGPHLAASSSVARSPACCVPASGLRDESPGVGLLGTWGEGVGTNVVSSRSRGVEDSGVVSSGFRKKTRPSGVAAAAVGAVGS